MSDHTTNTMSLSALATTAASSGEWWKENALDARSELELPTRVLVALDNAGIHTVEQLRAAGPHKLREVPHIGKQGFQQIIELLRALDRQANGGGSHDHEQGKTTLR